MNNTTSLEKGKIEIIVENYRKCNIKTLPLKSRTKEAFISGWVEKSHEELWSQGYNFNVGIQLDGNLICVDADNYKTVKLFDSLLAVYNPPTIKTRGGKHYYFRVKDGKWDKSYTTIKGQYSGEIRLQNCYMVAPPSFVLADNYKTQSLGDHQYELILGDFNNVPVISQEVVEMWITTYCVVTTTKLNEKRIISVDAPPTEQLDTSFNQLVVPLYKRNWDSLKYLKAKILELDSNPHPTMTYGFITYSSRSEIRQSITVGLILAGYDKADIYNIFIEYNLILKDNVNYYFELGYDKAIAWVIGHNLINQLQQLYYNDVVFKHNNDRLLYKAIISTGIQFITMTPYLTKTAMMKITHIRDYRSLNNSLNRLINTGYIGHLQRDSYQILGTPLTGKERMYLFTVSSVPNSSLSATLGLEKLLGKSDVVINYLRNNECRTSDIYKNTELNKRSTLSQLKKLVKLELVNRREESDRKVYYSLVDDVDDVLYELSVREVLKNTTIINDNIDRLNAWKNESRLYYGLVALKYDNYMIKTFIRDGRGEGNWFTEILHDNTLEEMVDMFVQWLHSK